jgi:integrase
MPTQHGARQRAKDEADAIYRLLWAEFCSLTNAAKEVPPDQEVSTDVAMGLCARHLWGAARRAGLRRIRWHDLRRSFASQLITAGVSIRQVQEWMGHSTIGMTMRYAHLAPGGGADLIRALEAPEDGAAWQRCDNGTDGATETDGAIAG